jgi:hypothetical protein
MSLVLLCVGLLALTGDAPSPLETAKGEYEKLRAQSGRTPDDQVKLALWCEARGLPAERVKHLALAVLADPTHATARALLGLVAFEGKWKSPEAIAEAVTSDRARSALLSEYDAKRMKAPYTADGQWSLGLWCDERGLRDQAKAHLTAVVRLDPTRDAAWKRLGFKKHDGRWTTDAEFAAGRLEAEAQKQADRQWKPILERCKSQLDQPSKRPEAEATLAAITDPRAVPSIGRVFLTRNTADQARAVRLLGQVDAPSASRMLAYLAIASKSSEVRRVAIEILRQRDPRDFVHLWIALIRDPIKYQVESVGGPGMPGSLTVEGARANLKRVYAPPLVTALAGRPPAQTYEILNGFRIQEVVNAAPPIMYVAAAPVTSTDVSQLLTDLRGTKANSGMSSNGSSLTGGPLSEHQPPQILAPAFEDDNPIRGGILDPARRMIRNAEFNWITREAQTSAAVASQQLSNDVNALEYANELIHQTNRPVLRALQAITGAELGEDRSAWDQRWIDRLGYASGANANSTKPTIVESVQLGYEPQDPPTYVLMPQVSLLTHACFAAGTAVQTVTGPRSIELIRPGDQVLTQDTKEGALSYQPVLAAFHNPPNATFRVNLGDDAVTATGIHRFWKVGQGWAMARDLRPGDRLRTLGGVATVASVIPDRIQPVFNLEVASGRSFFVGHLGALVHDNSTVESTPEPFDRR